MARPDRRRGRPAAAVAPLMFRAGKVATALLVGTLVAAALAVAAPATAAESVVSVDSAGDVGTNNSMVLDADGNPVIVYTDRGDLAVNTDDTVKLVHCDDPDCLGPETPVVIADGRTEKESLELDADGNPVVAYWRNPTANTMDLRLAKCGDPDCSTTTQTIVDGNDFFPQSTDKESVGVYAALELDADGNPVIAYSGPASMLDGSYRPNVVLVAHCNDPVCAGGDESIQAPDQQTADQPRSGISLQLDAEGRPTMSYVDPTAATVRYLHCSDVDCVGRTINLVTDGVFTFAETSMRLDSAGNPVITYATTGSSANLMLARCDDPACDGSDPTPQVVDDAPQGRGLYNSLVLAEHDIPVISYRRDNPSSQDLAVVRCGDAACSSGNTIHTIALGAAFRLSSSLRLDAAGNPVMSAAAAGGDGVDLKLVHCATPSCVTNTAPTDIALSDASVPENEPAGTIVGELSGTDVGDTLSFSLVAGSGDSGNGSFEITGTTLTTTTSFDREAQASYSVRVRATDVGGFTYDEALTITVANVNETPTADDDSATVAEDASVTMIAPGVLDGDVDPDGDTLSAQHVSDPAHGTVTLDGSGEFTYEPAPDYNGADSFTYRASDGALASGTATVDITVTPVNDAPDAMGDIYSTTEDTALTVTSPGAGVLGNDADVDGQPLTAVLVAGPAHGSLALGADGSFTYTPAPDYFGSDSFTYRASDGTALSAITSVQLTVSAVNDPPTAEVVAGGSCNVSTVAATLRLRLADADGPSPTVSAASSDTGVATATMGGSGAGRTVTITGRKAGTATVTITASDGAGGSTSTAITVRVGSNGAETIVGGAGSDMIFGVNGVDTLSGMGGADYICSGNGMGTTSGGDGNDTVDGQNGDDVIRGEAGDDVLTGGKGSDRFSGGPGVDTLIDFGRGDTSDGT